MKKQRTRNAAELAIFWDQKTCTKCEAMKDLDQYDRNARCLDDRQSACKDCVRAESRRWKIRNASANAAGQKRWRDANAAGQAEVMRVWRAANPDKLRDYWARHNAACNAARRARLRKQRCTCCGHREFLPIYREARRLGLQVDHVKPIAKGGLHCVSNLQLLSKIENLKKGSKYLEAA